MQIDFFLDGGSVVFVLCLWLSLCESVSVSLCVFPCVEMAVCVCIFRRDDPGIWDGTFISFVQFCKNAQRLKTNKN